MDIIKTEDLVFEYIRRDEEGNVEGITEAVDHVDMHVKPGEFIAILGHNGSGKSTLAKHFNAILTPTEGTVWVDGKDTRQEKNLWDIRQEAGMVFQNPDNQIIGQVVEEDVGFGPENIGIPTKEIWERVEESLKAVGMYEYRKYSPNKLSGGQKQRVSIAGVIAMHPKCIVLDEPTAFLDLANKYEIVHILHELSSGKGKTVLFSTHDLTTAIAQSDRMWIMLNDSVQQGSPEDLILAGDFASLFQSDNLFFDQQKGDFRIRKQTKRKAVVSGEGIAVDWTRKALERNGFEIVDSVTGSENFAFVSINVAYPQWTVKYLEQSNKFSSLLSLCRYLNGL